MNANQTYTIRRAIPEDSEAVFAVKREGWLDTYPNEEFGITRKWIESRTRENLKQIEQRKSEIANRDLISWIAQKEDEMVGVCTVKEKEAENQIAELYVLPREQGSGIGTELLQEALGYLGADKDVYVEVASYNDKAIKFYKKFGFVRDYDVPEGECVRDGDIVIPEVRLIKRYEIN